MDLRLLEYFVTVYEERNLSVSARRCGVSQPSISTAMRTLETTLGCPLLARHARGVVPTSEGERLYPRAVKLLGEAKAIKQTIRNNSTPKEVIRLALTRFVPLDRLGTFVREFKLSADGYDLVLVDEQDTADLRLVTHETLQDSELFSPIWQDHFVVAFPLSYAPAPKAKLSLADLDKLPWLSRKECEAERALSLAMQDAGLAPSVLAEVTSDEMALTLATEGVGACLLPDHIVTGPKIHMIELSDIVLERNIGLAYNHNFPLTDPLQQVFGRCKRLWQRQS